MQKIPTSWAHVLELADLWQFEEIRKRAITYLTLADGMTRLLVATKFKIAEWVVPALKDLGNRDAPLTVKELEDLGADLAVKVIAVREMVRPRKYSVTCVFRACRLYKCARSADSSYDMQQ